MTAPPPPARRQPSVKAMAIWAYVAFTLVTTVWYLIAANTGSSTPDPHSGRTYEITNRVLVGVMGGIKGGGSPFGYDVPVYVGLVSYCVSMAALANWIILVLAGVWRFLKS